MDQKAARKSRLEELRRLRQEGGSNLQNLHLDDQDDPEFGGRDEEGDEYGDAEDLKDFIEDASPSVRNRSTVPSKREQLHRPLASFFKRSASNGKTSSKDEGDDYLKTLMQQLDDEESESSSSSEDEKVAAVKDNLSEETMTISMSAVVDEAPPSEMFAPFDPSVLTAAVTKQLEDELEDGGDWDVDMLDELERKQMEMEGVESVFMKENVEPMSVSDLASNIPMQDSTINPASAIVSPGLEYEAPGEGFLDFYWIDAHERGPIIYLFGKARQPSDGSLVGCCVTVTGLQRNLFFLPREYVLGEDGEETTEEVSLGAVQAEIGELMMKHRVSKFGCKVVGRKYAFEVPDIPVEADWIKVVYGFGNGPALPAGLHGKTFSHVFGTSTSPLELLLLKRKMMGPGWLRLKPSSWNRTGVSWCKMEVEVSDPKKCLAVLPNGPEAPPMTVLSLTLRTTLNGSHQHEIVSASGLVYTGVTPDGPAPSRCDALFTVVRDMEGVGFPARFTETLTRAAAGTRIEFCRNEKMLLSFLLAMLQKYDPDFIVGHNWLGFDLGVLLHRMRANKVEMWSRLGRLNWSQWPRSGKAGSSEASWAEKQIISGRLVCDTWLASRELVKAKTHSLAALSAQLLGEAERSVRDDSLLDPAKMRTVLSSPDSLLAMLRRAERDAYLQSMLMFRLMVLPLTKQLTCIAGNLWSRTLAGARAERNEYLLLHEFHQAKYICPDARSKAYMVPAAADEDGDEDGDGEEGRKAGPSKRKPAYAGGLVLEPKRGFYDKIVLLLDFNSLYPSIIQEYNICFTTVARDPASEELPDVPEPGEQPGVLPRVLKALVEKRGAVKRLMKNPKTPPSLLAQYNIRQQALKLTANSMYGCLGFPHSRFYAKPLAMLITSRGRSILQSTVHLAQQSCHLDVIYGDTDSIMLHTGTTDIPTAKKMAGQVKRAVNERYRLLEIELDGMFERLLLLRKKKYAALVVEEDPRVPGGLSRKLETKGLDMVRRDWSALSVQSSQHVLDLLMYGCTGSAQSPVLSPAEDTVQAIHAHLQDLSARLQSTPADSHPTDLFAIHKNLTKDPEAYVDAKGQPHVAVALRMKGKGISVKAGDTIPYIICTDTTTTTSSSSLSMAERAYHPDELASNPALAIDIAWYLAQQVLPPVSRLCECIEGTDTARLALCLGLDAKKYAASSMANSSSVDQSADAPRLMAFLSDEEKFRDVQRLQLTCNGCKHSFEMTAPINNGLPGMQCPACSTLIPPPSLYCQVIALIRATLSTYHSYRLLCNDPACAATTNRMRVYESRCIHDSCRGSMHPIVPGSGPYYQLLYLRSLFDWEKCKAKISLDDDATPLLLKRLAGEYEPVRSAILHQLNQCSYPIINLRDVFSFMTI